MSIQRLVLVQLLTIVFYLPSAATPKQAGQPVPPGHTAANNATRQSENVEPPAPVKRTISAADLQKQADELLSLAQQIHTGTQRASEGLVDKDLKDKLRRMEKLSKKLREELGL
jgi:peptide subunit release factor 1 (eRF1)